MKHIGILYHPKRKEAISFSHKLEDFLTARNITSWSCSAWEPDKAKMQLPGSDLVLCIGGDGTILRAVRAIIPLSVPVLGINLGRLGFMTEFKANDALNELPGLLDGKGWIEERAILEAGVTSQDKTLYGLNDVFVGRRSLARLITIECSIDGEVLTTYRADGIIIATASGSTGYSLAACGPILHPQSKDIILNPICSHFTFSESLVLPSHTTIKLKVTTSHEAMFSIDGQVESQLQNGDEITIRLSSYTARFLRLQPESYFFKTLESRLKRKVS
jgi:NAD+ kinase